MAYLDQMNVKANEQDTVGTDYDLRDKDLNAATTKTSVATTDGVVLKGTDGSYHTIDRSSLTEAVRSVLGGILNNMTSKGTAVKGVGVIDNSNDFGLTTPSDLASVLGVTLDWNGVVTSDTDLNDILGEYRALLYKVNGTWPVNAPSGIVGAEAFFICQEVSKGIGVPRYTQMIVSDAGQVYTRHRNLGSGGVTSWCSWYTIPSFYKNYADIYQLSGGVFGGANSIPANSSTNSLGFGIHFSNNVATNNITDVPTELADSSHAIAVFVWRYSNERSMMLIDIEGGGIWTRLKVSSNWIKA